MDTKEYLKQVMLQKDKEKMLNREAELKEGKQTIASQIQHFYNMEKRYRDIFEAIDHKDRKIQDTYMKLAPG